MLSIIQWLTLYFYISCNLALIFSFPPWCYQSRRVTLVWRKVESFELYDSRDNAKEFDDNQRNFQFCFNRLQKDVPIDFHTRKVYKAYYINIVIKSINNLYLKPKEKTGYTCLTCILTLINSFLIALVVWMNSKITIRIFEIWFIFCL